VVGHRSSCLSWTRLDPWQDVLYVLVCKILKPGIRGSPGIMFPQDLRNCLGVDLLRQRQQSVGLVRIPDRLLVQASFREAASLHRLCQGIGRICRLLTISHIVLPGCQTVAPIGQGANSADPKSYSSLLVRSPEATLKMCWKICSPAS
jgi:hypothetical protein